MTVQTDRSSKNEKSDLEDRIYLYVNLKNLKQHEMHASVNMVKVKMDLSDSYSIHNRSCFCGGREMRQRGGKAEFNFLCNV